MNVRLKRIYDSVAAFDGGRLLIDRLWPPGFTREDAHSDEWARDLGPSTELRRWFGQQPARWEEFRRRYAAELIGNETLLAGPRRRWHEARLQGDAMTPPPLVETVHRPAPQRSRVQILRTGYGHRGVVTRLLGRRSMCDATAWRVTEAGER
jgi:uncharacterized protein YeaO (DUF488 family)